MFQRLHFELGQSIISDTDIHYRCLQKLGEGRNAFTILVVPSSGPNRGVLFALKIFQRLSNEESRKRFSRETAFLRSCTHPSIMPIYDSGIFKASYNSYPFVVAEYLPHRLYDIIRSNAASFTEKIAYALQLISALDYLASLRPPAVHRDIKPENIFVKGKSCVLGDFGLMKRIKTGKKVTSYTFRESEGAVMPFSYRTPDLIAYAKGEAQLTPKSDVFQLGLVLAELFTGKNPAQLPSSETDDLVLEPIGHISGNLGGLIHSLIKEMLEFDWDKRIAAADLFDKWQTAFFKAAELSYPLNERVI